jgi:hypothetical protein
METTGRTGNSADAFMGAMEQCYNTRMGDGAPGLFLKIKSAYFMELGMILARGSAKICEWRVERCDFANNITLGMS